MLVRRALAELHELRADLAVLVRARQIVEERFNAQKKLNRDAPFHLSDEGCAVLGSLRLSIKSLDDKITEYKLALSRLEQGNEQQQQSTHISLVWDADADGNSGSGDPEPQGT